MTTSSRSTTHRRQRAKNLFALALLALLVTGLYYLTVLKLGGH